LVSTSKLAAAGIGAAAAAGGGGGGLWLYKRRKRRISKKKALLLVEHLFGIQLEDLHPKFLHPNGIPLVIEDTCAQLEKQGAEIEGIFRVPGSHSRMTEISELYENGLFSLD
jgi:hypothetical protein